MMEKNLSYRLARFKKMAGFSLIEIMVASIVLGVGIVGTAKFQGDIVRNSTTSKQQVEAVNIARLNIEKMLHIANATDFQALVTSQSGTKTVEGNTAVYQINWEVSNTISEKDAKISISVSWGEESVQLATILSSTTPAVLTLTEQAPPRDPLLEPEYVANVFPVVSSANPSNAENICKCNGSVAVASNSLPAGSSQFASSNKHQSQSVFMKVGGMNRWGSWEDDDGDGVEDDDDSYERPVNGASPECTLCCASANAQAMLERAEKNYAKLENEFIDKVRYEGDQSLSIADFSAAYLFKGYNKNLLNPALEEFMKTSSSESWSWSENDDGDDDDDSDPATFTFTAACGIDYDPPPAATVAVPDPPPVAKRARCVYYKRS